MTPAATTARTIHVEAQLTAYRAGKLDRLTQALVYTQIIGWMDLCSDSDRELYRGLAREWKASGAAG